MGTGDTIPRPEKVEVKRSTLEALKGRVALERKQSVRLLSKYENELTVTRRALEEAVTARHEREQYRRVLASAIANEKNAKEQAASAARQVSELEARLGVELEEKGRSKGRAQELDAWLKAAAADHAQALLGARGEGREERERVERALSVAVFEKGRAEGRARELAGQLQRDLPPSARFLRLRGIGLFMAGGVAFIAALTFLPPLLTVLFASPAGVQMQLAYGLSAWQIFGVELLLLALGITLASFAIHDFRASERPGQDVEAAPVLEPDLTR